MPAAKSRDINLLGDTSLERSPYGRIITWAVTYGRYIMIGTEIVVLLAFISRFSLDRKLTDLKEEIAQKQAIIEANVTFELEVKNLQDRLDKIKTLLVNQAEPVATLRLIQAITPTDVILESFDLTKNKLTVGAVAASNDGFSLFLSNLVSTKELAQVEIGDINKDPATGIKFKISTQVSKLGIPTPTPTKKP